MISYEVVLPQIVSYVFNDDGVFPNSTHPVLVYKHCVLLPDKDQAQVFVELFDKNGWTKSWVNGIYNYHHYHSNAHEVLGIYSGSVNVQLGGESGIYLELKAGDVIVIPAGVAHKKITASDDFGCVGAYANGQDYDINTGEKNERPKTDENIRHLSLPATDPVYGEDRYILQYWVD